MSTISASAARRRCLVSLPCFLLSISGVVELTRLRAGYADRLPDGERRLAEVRAQLAASAQLPADRDGAMSLTEVLAGVLDTLRAGDDRHGVRLGLVAIPGRSGSLRDGPADAQALAQLAHPIPGAPGLRALRVDLHAVHRQYLGLREWFAELEHWPVQFHQVLLEESQVQISASVLGR